MTCIEVVFLKKFDDGFQFRKIWSESVESFLFEKTFDKFEIHEDVILLCNSDLNRKYSLQLRGDFPINGSLEEVRAFVESAPCIAVMIP